MTMTQQQTTALAHFIFTAIDVGIRTQSLEMSAETRRGLETKKAKAHAEFIEAFTSNPGGNHEQ